MLLKKIYFRGFKAVSLLHIIGHLAKKRLSDIWRQHITTMHTWKVHRLRKGEQVICPLTKEIVGLNMIFFGQVN